MVPGRIYAYYLPNPKTIIINVYAYIDIVNMELSFSSLVLLLLVFGVLFIVLTIFCEWLNWLILPQRQIASYWSHYTGSVSASVPWF